MKRSGIYFALIISLGLAWFLQASEIRGRWNAERERENRLQLNLRYGASNNGFQISIAELPDLRKLLQAGATNVTFRLIRDAGILHFIGEFDGDEGLGSFEFEPSAEFAPRMAEQGYEDLDEEDMYRLAVLDVSPAFVQELASAGYTGLSLENLIEMRIFNVTADFINEMKSVGLDLPVSRLVEFRIHGVTPEFIRELSGLGYTNVSPSRLVEFRIHGVTPGFIRSIQAQGYKDVRASELVEMRIFGVDSDFIEETRARKNNISVRDLIEMKILGR